MDEKTLLRAARLAREKEKARLRPLLERLLRVIDDGEVLSPDCEVSRLRADLRHELGKES